MLLRRRSRHTALTLAGLLGFGCWSVGCSTYDASLVPPADGSAGQGGDMGGSSAAGAAGQLGGESGAGGMGPVDDADAEGGSDGASEPPVDASYEGSGGSLSSAEAGDSARREASAGSAGNPLADSGQPEGAVVMPRDAAIEASREAGPLVEELIDDMEDGNNAIPMTNGRVGIWSVSNDGTVGAVQMPTNPFTMATIADRAGSTRAAYTAGHGFTGWGAQMLVQLNKKGTSAKQPYDASAYAGISFWAKIGAAHQAMVQVRIPDLKTDPEGGVCSGATCNDYHESAPVTWTTDWQKYEYYFTDLPQVGFGVPLGPLDVAHIYEIQFTVVGAVDGPPFEFWVDDLAFILK